MKITQEIKRCIKFSIITFCGIFGIGVFGMIIIWYGYNLHQNKIISDLGYQLIALSPLVLCVLYMLFILWWSAFRKQQNSTIKDRSES